MNLFHTYSTVLLLLWAGLMLVILVAVVDAAIRPTRAYVAAGKQTKLLWVLVLAVAGAGAFLAGVTSIFGIAGLIAAIVYLVDVRPALRAVGGGGSRGGTNGPYGPW